MRREGGLRSLVLFQFNLTISSFELERAIVVSSSFRYYFWQMCNRVILRLQLGFGPHSAPPLTSLGVSRFSNLFAHLHHLPVESHADWPSGLFPLAVSQLVVEEVVAPFVFCLILTLLAFRMVAEVLAASLELWNHCIQHFPKLTVYNVLFDL